MVSYKSVFRALFRSDTDDTVFAPSSSKSRPKPSRAFTVPASPARPNTFAQQPAAGPSTRKYLNPYANNPNRHSAVALRDIISPRPRLRKNSLPSQFPEEHPTLPPRVASPIPIAEDPHSQEQRQRSDSPILDPRQSDDDYLRQSHPSLDVRRLDSLNGDPKLCDHLDASFPNFGVRESSDISLLLSPEPEDARKAISKRLEGLAMALDMFQPIQPTSPAPAVARNLGLTSKGLPKLDTSLDVTHPLITFPLSPKSVTALGSELLSPIENWGDEEGAEQSPDQGDTLGDDDDDLSYFYLPASKFSHSSHSSSSVSSSTSELPPTPADLSSVSVDAVQLLPPFLPRSPVAFNLGPVVQSRVDNCKSTPTPVVSVDACDAQSGIVRI